MPYCNADGKRPMRDAMPDGVLPSYYALYPAAAYCAPGFERDLTLPLTLTLTLTLPYP